MSSVLHILLTVVIVLAVLFAVTFTVYFFNLEMKLLALIEPLIAKHYDRIKRDKHL